MISPTQKRAERVVEVTGEMVDCVMSDDAVIREPKDGGCENHRWKTEIAEEYDKPGPDPRNPIHAFECKKCEAEKHTATHGRYFDGTRTPRTSAIDEPGIGDHVKGAVGKVKWFFRVGE